MQRLQKTVPFYVTAEELLAYRPCTDEVVHFMKHTRIPSGGDGNPLIPLSLIYEINGPGGYLWVMRNLVPVLDESLVCSSSERRILWERVCDQYRDYNGCQASPEDGVVGDPFYKYCVHPDRVRDTGKEIDSVMRRARWTRTRRGEQYPIKGVTQWLEG